VTPRRATEDRHWGKGSTARRQTAMSTPQPQQQQQQQQQPTQAPGQGQAQAQNAQEKPPQQQHQQQQPTQQRPNQTPQGNAADSTFNLTRLVQEYLLRKGYSQTESTLRIEATKIPGSQTVSVSNATTPYSQPSTISSDKSNLQFQQQQYLVKQNISKQRAFDENPAIFARAYLLYRSWCENSLEMYKYELEKLLYPFYVHSYLALVQRNETEAAHDFWLKFKSDHLLSHNDEIKNLLTITLADHLNENKYAKLFLSNKYKINISNTSLNLILGFLNENQAIGGAVLIRFLNSHFDFNTQLEVTTSSNENMDHMEGIPEIYQLINLGSAEDDSDKFKSTKSAFISEHEKPLKLGPYPQDEDFTKELEAELKHKDDAAQKAAEDANTSTNSTPAAKRTLMEEYNENFKQDPKNPDSPAKGTLPLPQKSVYDLKRAIQEVQDSRSRIRLSSASYSHLNTQPSTTPGTPSQRYTYISQPALPSICQYTFHNTNNDLTSLEFHPDSTMIAGGFQDSFIKLWSIDGSPLKSVLRSDPYNHDIDSASAGLPGNTSRKLIGHSGPVYGLSFSPDGHYLLSSSADSTVRLWSLDTYSALVSYKGHGGAGGGGLNSPVWDVAFSPLGHYFATASHDQTARLWSCDHIYPLRIFAGHLNDVDVVKFHPNGTYLFTGSSDKTVRMWDVARAESVRLFVGHTSPISDIACSPDGRWLATASVNEENYLSNSFGVSDWASSIGGGFTPSGKPTDGEKVATGSSDKDKQGDDGKDDASSEKKQQQQQQQKQQQHHAPQATFTGSVIHIWDIASGRKLKTMRGHGAGGIHSLSWSRGGEVLVSGGADGSVRVWDAKRGTLDTVAGGRPERFAPNGTGAGIASNATTTSASAAAAVGGSVSSATSSAGGTNASSIGKNGAIMKDDKRSAEAMFASSDHMSVYFTKKTPVYKVAFTRRNLCLSAGPYMG
jgi:transcription initiation factor TFIID subunit 5